jgi:hypothetical protein
MNRLRRKLLAWLAVGTGSLCLAPCPALSRSLAPIDLSLLGFILGDLHSAATIAARLPADADLAPEAILLYEELADYAGDNSRQACLACYQARREEDFASGLTVLVDGWLLARSEAALCWLVKQSS